VKMAIEADLYPEIYALCARNDIEFAQRIVRSKNLTVSYVHMVFVQHPPQHILIHVSEQLAALQGLLHEAVATDNAVSEFLEASVCLAREY